MLMTENGQGFAKTFLDKLARYVKKFMKTTDEATGKKVRTFIADRVIP